MRGNCVRSLQPWVTPPTTASESRHLRYGAADRSTAAGLGPDGRPIPCDGSAT